MAKLYNAQTGALIGEVDAAQIAVLRKQLEEEDTKDQDYYINAMTIDLIESAGGNEQLVTILRQALGDNEDMDIRWER